MKTPRLLAAAFAFVALLFVSPGLLLAADGPAKPPALPTAHTTRNIEGWNVRVDDRLLHGAGAAVGERALKLLTARLVAITIVVPEKALAKLRAITIELDLNYGDLTSMQYHPDAGWLKEHGYSAQLAKCVHIPEAEDFLSPFENHRMPWVVLHELAHGFHDQVLEHLLDDMWLETAHEILVVSLRDARIKLSGETAKGALFAEEIRRPESTRAHATGEVGGIHPDDRTPLALRRNRRNHCPG